MKYRLFIIFGINIVLASQVATLPKLGCIKALKETSGKDMILTGLTSLSLGLLSYKFFPKDKPWLKKSLTGLGMLVPLAISGARSIYFGETKNQDIFNKKNCDRGQTKHNIFLERLLLLANSNPKEAYTIFKKQDHYVFIGQFKKGQEDPLYKNFTAIQKEESQKNYIDKFQTQVNQLTKENAVNEIPKLCKLFSKNAPNKELADILINKIKDIELDQETIKTIFSNDGKQKKNIYVTAFVTFQLIEYTQEEVMEKISTIIQDNNWTDHIDKTIGREIKVLLEKNLISKQEIDNVITTTFKNNEKKKIFILHIFNNNVFAENAAEELLYL